MPAEGKLIVLEGVDEALLSAQVERLYRWLRGEGIAVEQTGEPTRGPVGVLIRLHQQGRLQLDPASLSLLWVADRMDHLRREGGILDWLRQGRVVLCARYLLYSYAILGDQVELDWLCQINTLCRLPDLTLYVEPLSSQIDADAVPDERMLERYERILGREKTVVRITDCASEALVEHACRRHIAHLLSDVEMD
jgi:dTMP kinase